MGLLSKNERVCSHCGSAYKALIDSQGGLCEKCHAESKALKDQMLASIDGYDDYRSRLKGERYNGFELAPIIEHKEKMVEKFTRPSIISRKEILMAGMNYKKLTNEQAQDILSRALSASIGSTMGAAYSEGFFALTGYDNVIVDAKDVYAVAFKSDHKLNVGFDDAILCVILTKDPYIPAFPMLFVGKVGCFEGSKSKKGRKEAKELFEAMCPNLVYPIDEMKVLIKQVKKEDTVKAEVSKEDMLSMLDLANRGIGVFDTRNMYSSLTSASAELLDSMGYIQRDELGALLEYNKMFHRRFWDKQMKKLGAKQK